MTEPVGIEVREVAKRFAERTVLDGVNMSLRRVKRPP